MADAILRDISDMLTDLDIQFAWSLRKYYGGKRLGLKQRQRLERLYDVIGND